MQTEENVRKILEKWMLEWYSAKNHLPTGQSPQSRIPFHFDLGPNSTDLICRSGNFNSRQGRDDVSGAEPVIPR